MRPHLALGTLGVAAGSLLGYWITLALRLSGLALDGPALDGPA